jgi:hypothetical protein
METSTIFAQEIRWGLVRLVRIYISVPFAICGSPRSPIGPQHHQVSGRSDACDGETRRLFRHISTPESRKCIKTRDRR